MDHIYATSARARARTHAHNVHRNTIYIKYISDFFSLPQLRRFLSHMCLPPLSLIVSYFLPNCERAAEKLPEPNVRCWSQQRGDREGCGRAVWAALRQIMCGAAAPPPLPSPHPPPTSPPFLRAIWDVWGSREVRLGRWRTHWPM